MKKNIVIFGSGSHSKVIFSEIIKLRKFNILGFVDDFSKKGKIITKFNGKQYLNLGNIKQFIGDIKSKKKKLYKNISGIVGIGLNYKRKKIVKEITKYQKKYNWETIISKDCILNGDVKVGVGSFIMSGVIINTGSVIGNHCILNTSSSIDHDNIFKDYSSSGPGVISGGNITVGDSSHLGIGCVIRNNISIGNNVVIGGNSYVNKNCKENSLYFGVPAKRLKNRKLNDNYL